MKAPTWERILSLYIYKGSDNLNQQVTWIMVRSIMAQLVSTHTQSSIYVTYILRLYHHIQIWKPAYILRARVRNEFFTHSSPAPYFYKNIVRIRIIKSNTFMILTIRTSSSSCFRHSLVKYPCMHIHRARLKKESIQPVSLLH